MISQLLLSLGYLLILLISVLLVRHANKSLKEANDERREALAIYERATKLYAKIRLVSGVDVECFKAFAAGDVETVKQCMTWLDNEMKELDEMETDDGKH